MAGKDTKDEHIVVEQVWNVPFRHYAGEVTSRYLKEFRDNKRIMGRRCPKCKRVLVPARKNCGTCFEDIDEWVEVKPEGVIEAFTIVHYSHPVQPVKPPFAYALIRLDGADVGFLHLIKKDLDKIKNGLRVKAKFSGERTGKILDIDSFELA